MDRVGERAIATSLRAAGHDVPPAQELRRWAVAADLLANSAIYSLVACGRDPHVWRRGVALGLAAGTGALVLPRQFGLGETRGSAHIGNQLMTVAWYLIGGLSAAAAGKGLLRPAGSEDPVPHRFSVAPGL